MVFTSPSMFVYRANEVFDGRTLGLMGWRSHGTDSVSSDDFLNACIFSIRAPIAAMQYKLWPAGDDWQMAAFSKCI